MSYAALIERFDRHMTRIDEELRLSREASERQAAMYDDHREFIREMTLRVHRSAESFAQRMDTLEERSQRHSDATIRVLAEQSRMLADQSDAVRANTAAVLAVLDRLDDK